MNENFTEEQEHPLGTRRVDEATGTPELYVQAGEDIIPVEVTVNDEIAIDDKGNIVVVKPDPTAKPDEGSWNIDESDFGRTKHPCLNCGGRILRRPEYCSDTCEQSHTKPSPGTKILVLQLRDRFAKQYTCRTVDELEIFITNYKATKNIKRDEDMAIEIGFGWMLQSDYDKLPACEYFIKPH